MFLMESGLSSKHAFRRCLLLLQDYIENTEKDKFFPCFFFIFEDNRENISSFLYETNP